ncbi:MAG: hypothetical protein KA715_03445 [Xanthomonadaceae bacterium]|nr:hypothetical protein [Xanthomonadaceae bacterium]
MLKVWLAIFNFAVLASDQNLSLPSVDFKRVSGDQEITVGDRVTLEVEGAQDIQALIMDEDIKKEWVESGFAVFPSDQVKQPYRISIVPLKGGSLNLPSLFFKNSKAETFLRSNPFPISVKEFKSESKEPPPNLLGPMVLDFPKEFIILIGVLVILVLGTIYYELKEYLNKKKTKPFSKKIKLPEDEFALIQISNLEKSEIYKSFQFKKIYFSLSEIIKTYLGDRYQFDALESTSREVVMTLENSGVGVNLVRDFDDLFKKMDLIKFTETPADRAQAEALIIQIKRLIDVTKKPKPISNQGEAIHEIR